MELLISREIRPENGYSAALVDYGIDFYAPETTKLKDGIMAFTNTFFFKKSISDFIVENSASNNLSYVFWKLKKQNL